MIQPAIDLFDGERSHPCRRQLDGERDPVQPMTNRNERRSVLVGDPKIRVDIKTAIDEKLQCLEWDNRGWRMVFFGIG